MVERDLTQVELALRSGVDRSLISRIHSGDRPVSAGALVLLAAAFEITPAALAEGTDAEEVRARVGEDPQVPARVAVQALLAAETERKRAMAAELRAESLERQLGDALAKIGRIRQALHAKAGGS